MKYHEYQLGDPVIFDDENKIRVEGELVHRASGCFWVQVKGVRRLVPFEQVIDGPPDSPELKEYFKTEIDSDDPYIISIHQRRIRKIWQACEKAYDLEGGDRGDKRRELAIAILKGDPMAMDMATDMLRI